MRPCICLFCRCVSLKRPKTFTIWIFTSTTANLANHVQKGLSHQRPEKKITPLKPFHSNNMHARTQAPRPISHSVRHNNKLPKQERTTAMQNERRYLLTYSLFPKKIKNALPCRPLVIVQKRRSSPRVRCNSSAALSRFLSCSAYLI